MNYTLRLLSNNSVGVYELRFLDTSSNLLSVSNQTLVSGSLSLGWDSLLFSVGNTNQVTATPASGVVSFSFDVPSEINFVRVVSEKELSLSIDLIGSENNVLRVSPQYYYVGGMVHNVFVTQSPPSVYVDPTLVSNYKNVSYFTTGVETSGSVQEGSKIRFGFIDTTDPSTRWTSWRTLNTSSKEEPYNPPPYYPSTDRSNFKLREKSALANLYAQQAPAVLDITVTHFSPTQDRVRVRTDKECQVSIYVLSDDNSLNEQNILVFTRDNNALSKDHYYFIPKLSGKNKVVAVPSQNSYSKDFQEVTPLNTLNSYSYSIEQTAVSRYEEGLATGYKQAYQEVYTLGGPFGFNFDFGSRNDYGTSAVNNQFISVVGDGQYIQGLKEVYTRGAAFGYTFNSSSTDRSYYANQQPDFISKLTSAGAIEAYKSIFDRGIPYGFTYDGSQTVKAYYQNKEASFVNTIDSFSGAREYKKAYSEFYSAGRNYEGIAGIPEGGALWINDTSTNPNFASNLNTFIRHLYNSGYVRAKQETFDRGLPYTFDYRPLVNVSKPISDQTILNDYLSIGGNFIDTVTAAAKNNAYNDVYNHVDLAYGFNYDSTNVNSLPVAGYTSYLSSQKVNMVARINEATRIATYKEAFNVSGNDYGFVFDNNSQDVNYLKNLVTSSYAYAYNYGARAAYQDIYDQGGVYFFDKYSNYLSGRGNTTLLNTNRNDSTTDFLHSISQIYTDTVRDYGSVFTYKSFFDLASVFGFSYDATQTDLAYYGNLKPNFLDVYSAGNYSQGIKYVFEAEKNRYGFQYNFSPVATEMEAQVPGMMTFSENKIQADSYRYTLAALTENNFYNIPYSESQNSSTLKNQIVEKLNALKNASAAEAYNYVFITSNSRNAYTIPISSSATTLKSFVIPMFKYVEDFREADAYRRVHNYAKTFVYTTYDYTDSTDPRVLEMQVPNLFSAINDTGSYNAYKYVHDTASSMFGWTYVDTNTPSGLKEQIIPMFEFIKVSYDDIESISQPTFKYPNLLSFDVVLRRNAGLVGVLIDKATQEHLALVSELTPSFNHKLTFRVNSSQMKRPIDLLVIPTPRGQ